MRYYRSAAAFLTAFLFVACAEAPQNNDSTAVSPDFDLAGPHSSQQGGPVFQGTIAPQASVIADPYWQAQRFDGLDPREISQAEIDELIALEKRLQEDSQAFQTELQAWSAQDPASRGPKPVRRDRALHERLQTLNAKVEIASIRKTHRNIDPKILPTSAVEEYITLRQEQTRVFYEAQRAHADWAKMDPATRGPRPDHPETQFKNQNPRLQELHLKVRQAHGVQQETDRIKQLSVSHNIPLLDNEMAELIALHTERQTLQGEMNTAILQALTGPEGQINAAALSGGQLSADIIETLPKTLLYRVSEVNARIDDIHAPFETVAKAAKIREDLIKFSETSGVPISPAEIEEAVALNAEKDRIIKKTQREAERKWKAEGGPLNIGTQTFPNAEDAARLEEIEARLKEISAPLAEAN